MKQDTLNNSDVLNIAFETAKELGIDGFKDVLEKKIEQAKVTATDKIILQLLSDGYRPTEIASKIYRSSRTVEGNNPEFKEIF